MTGSWRSDPTGRHVYRYHDGRGWTDQVADGGAATTDPYDGPSGDGPPPPPDAGPPARATGPAPTAWPPGSTPGADAGWAAGPTTGSAPQPAPSGGGGWSTGARIGATVAVLAAMLVSGMIGFAIGAATDLVGDLEDLADDFDDFEPSDTSGGRAGPDDAAATGVVLSSDQPRFSGVLDGESAFDVQVTRRSAIVLEVVGADFDTYLLLYDASGQLVGSDDDSGDSLLSRIDAELDPGTYTLVVESYSGGVDAGERVELVATFERAAG